MVLKKKNLTVLVVFLFSLARDSSSSCYPHHGPGHNTQCCLQLPQQVSAHNNDVKQCEWDTSAELKVHFAERSKLIFSPFFLAVCGNQRKCVQEV